MNLTAMIGRLTRDPELRVIPSSGKYVANFTLAVDRPFDRKTADFHRIVCFGKTAENVGEYLKKGSQCAIQGQVQNNTYEDKNGVKHYGYQIIADRVEFLGSPEKSDNYDDYSSGVEIEEGDFPMIDDDDVPF